MKSDIASRLIETIQESPDLSAVTEEFADVVLGELFDEFVSPNIPFVGMATKFYNSTSSYSNYLLMKKILLFLRGICDVPENERMDQLALLAVDTEHRQRVGENLMLLLDKLDDMAKPALLSKAWKAFLESKVDRATLMQFNRVVEQINLEDLPVLKDLYNETTSDIGLVSSPFRANQREYIEPPYRVTPDEHHIDDRTWQRLLHLSHCGLLDMYFGRGGSIGGRQGGLRKNQLGALFVEHILV